MQAFSPGSITAVFTPLADGSGSRGASIATADGIRVTVTEAVETTITLDTSPTKFDPVERVLADLGVTADVALDAGVPVGCGFGASGAATLATALAANAEFDLGHGRETLLDSAHRAEVAAGTGLGDVFVQEAGGLCYDVGNGTERVESDARIGYTSFGGIETNAVLGDTETMERIRTEGTAVLSALSTEPTVREVVSRAWPFARRVGLTTERVVETVERVEERGGVATMAMVGETVVGVGADGELANETGVSNDGARLA